MPPLSPHPALLAQTRSPAAPPPAPGPTDPMQVVKVVGVLIGVVVVMTAIILLIRRRFLASQRDVPSAAGLMEQLRQMKLAGHLSEQEYESARARLSSRIKTEAAQARPDPRPTRTAARPSSQNPGKAR